MNQHIADNSYDSYSNKGYATSNDQSHDSGSASQQPEQTMENGNMDNGSNDLQEIFMKLGQQIVTKQQM